MSFILDTQGESPYTRIPEKQVLITKIYINGNEADCTSQYSKTDNICSSDGEIWIGDYRTGSHVYFNGTMDEVRIYNYSLTPEGIAAIANPHRADTSPEDGCVSMDEIMAFVQLWLLDSQAYPIKKLMEAVRLYYEPVNQCS